MKIRDGTLSNKKVTMLDFDIHIFDYKVVSETFLMG